MVTDKATKLFCEMNGSAQVINWKLITRGMPRGRQASIDRAPTIEEIQRIIEYPDRSGSPNCLYDDFFRNKDWCMGLLTMETCDSDG